MRQIKCIFLCFLSLVSRLAYQGVFSSIWQLNKYHINLRRDLSFKPIGYHFGPGMLLGGSPNHLFIVNSVRVIIRPHNPNVCLLLKQCSNLYLFLRVPTYLVSDLFRNTLLTCPTYMSRCIYPAFANRHHLLHIQIRFIKTTHIDYDASYHANYKDISIKIIRQFEITLD